MDSSSQNQSETKPFYSIEEKRRICEERRLKKYDFCNYSDLYRLEKKKLKKELGANQKNEALWPKCLFWIKKCSRFCSGERVENSKYCINHIHMESSTTNETTSGERKRVVCPIDPSHTVYEDKLQKHIRICNKTKKEDEKSNCPYFSPNLNCGNIQSPKEMIFHSESEVYIVVKYFLLEERI